MTRDPNIFSGDVDLQYPGHWPEEYYRDDLPRISRLAREWREMLSEEEYSVLRLGRTCSNSSREHTYEGADGVYRCAGCGLAVFHSATRFDDGTGWFSFWKPVSSGAVIIARHFPYMRRSVSCARCDGHLGHLFGDGPAPSRLRYCADPISLCFEASLAEDGIDG